MFFSWRKDDRQESSLREQGAAVARGVGDTISRGAAHVATLAELFRLEAGEYTGRLAAKLVPLAAGVFFAVAGYALLMACAACLLAEAIGWPLALGSLCAANFLVGGVLLLVARKRPLGPIAPETVREINNDVQCIRILLKEGNKNS